MNYDMKKLFMAVIALMMTISASAQFYIYFSDGQIAKVDSISVRPIAYTITLNHTEVELDQYESVRLSAAVSPLVINQEPAITWTSSNPEVAFVDDSGLVTALAAGTAIITATPDVEGVASATCVVTVTNDDILNFKLGGYGLFGTPSMVAGTDTVIELSDGSTFNCQLGYLSLYIWDENIVYNSSFSGAGFFIAADVPLYWITEGNYAGYYIGSSTGFFIDSVMTAYTAEAGQLVDLQAYGDGWNGILNATTQEETIAAQELYLSSQTGTQFLYTDFNTSSDDSYNCGNVSYLHLTEDDATGELYYDLKLEWYDHVSPNRWYGLLAETEVNEEGEKTITGIVKPYDMRVINKQYQVLPPAEEEAEAPARVQGKAKPAQYKISNQKLSLDGLKWFL